MAILFQLIMTKGITGLVHSVHNSTNPMPPQKLALYTRKKEGAAVAEWFSPRTDNAEVPGSNPSHGSCALRQGALSSLPSLSEETLSRRSRV